MNSLTIISVKKNIKDYIDNCGLPKEVMRMLLKEIIEDVAREAVDEAMQELKTAEMEVKNDRQETI